MDDFTNKALHEIKKLGATHIWYTGILAHASQTDYSAYGIPRNHPAVVKGKAGSPYAIRDYYDVDPDLAVHVDRRMEEFETLVQRSHTNGLKVIIDFVPNHVARQYHSIAKPEGVKDLGEDDDPSKAFAPDNNFYYIPGAHLGGEIDFYDEEQGLYDEMPAKATGNDRFDAYPNKTDWYETVKLNYGVDYIGNTGNPFRSRAGHVAQDVGYPVVLGFERHRRFPVRHGRDGALRVLGLGHPESEGALSGIGLYCRGIQSG